MDRSTCSLLLLTFALDSVCGSNRFFISAPKVFHVNVKEKVFVQTSSVTTLYLEDESSGRIVSDVQKTSLSHNGKVQTVELMIDKNKISLEEFRSQPYLLLVAETPERRMTRVLVSVHRGYIFIQTNQPIYKPSDKVLYRIFTLDHTMRPVEEPFEVSIFNSAGNRLHLNNPYKISHGGLSVGSLHLPDVAGLGTWKIAAHYEGDKENAATLEFQVQKFVLPSFEVILTAEEHFILLGSNTFHFTIEAKYFYGQSVAGSFNAWFRVGGLQASDHCLKVSQMIRGLEKTDSITDGRGTVTLSTMELEKQLQVQGCNLTYLEQNGAKLVMVVSVREQQSSELQEAEISLPIVSGRYEIDLSRTRSYFIPQSPGLEVMVILRLPDGSAASDVPVHLHALQSTAEVLTNQEGAAVHLFPLPAIHPAEIVVKVKADTTEQEKVIRSMSSLLGPHLYINVPNNRLRVGQPLGVTFQIINGHPKDGFLYYLVLSRGVLVHQGSLEPVNKMGSKQIHITAHMVPSLRLIGYYYSEHDVIVSDSVWLDVIDECETRVKVSSSRKQLSPGQTAQLEVEVQGEALVALGVVDKAMYAITGPNKLTAKQVFSAMESYDLGCSFGGGADHTAVFTDAGLSFVSSGLASPTINGLRCKSHTSSRARRSLALQNELMVMKGNLSAELQECCDQGFTQIPMRRSCEERQKKVSQMKKANPECAEIFLKCCLQGEAVRKRAAQDNGLGRTSSRLDIEEYFISNTAKAIRRHFAPSFGFTYFNVIDKKRTTLSLPDSITTWEIQAVTLSRTHGFCVAEPFEIVTFKNIFVSLRLPYSVRKHEQMSIVAVVYNYGQDTSQLAVYMEQVPGLCSTASSFVNISVNPESSQLVTFAAVPMMSGAIPIKIRLFDIDRRRETDAIEKNLNVLTEGEEKTEEFTLTLKFAGAEFGQSSARALLSAKGVSDLLQLPHGCAEQTMKIMAPTVLALRYLDLSKQWVQLPTGTRDLALKSTEQGLTKILEYKKDDGSYGAWLSHPTSHWLTALIVKVLSLLAERQSVGVGQRGHMGRDVTNEDISHSVRFLLSVQKPDGSFTDPNPVLDRSLQGGVSGVEGEMAMTAFITVALQHSIPFVDQNMKRDEAGISKSTAYLLSHVKKLKRPYAVAITAYCLAVCLPDRADAEPAWQQLQALATLDNNGCRLWKSDPKSLAAVEDAITVETTAYALLTAVAHEDSEYADAASCWLVGQENYGGGFMSTQDTIVALEALAEYDVKRPSEPFSKVEAEFFVAGRSDKMEASLNDPKDRVEVELKSMIGNEINVHLTGTGSIKMKVRKVFNLLAPKETCTLLSINVTVEGKAQYISKIIDNYQYFDEDYDYNKEESNTHTRRRRDADQRLDSDSVIVDISVFSLNSNLTGMAIADITLLSGFEVKVEDLDKLKNPIEPYISHYELSSGRVILYFNEIKDTSSITFEAKQIVPIEVLQPAQASFYDYYEPKKKCTIFYSAPRRSTQVSKMCSDDVCQCAERPCHEVRNLLATKTTKSERLQHACFHPTVDYRFVVEVLSVSVKSNFELYRTNVLKVLKATKDSQVAESAKRVFAKRLQCRAQLETGKRYLIMGKDGSTTDSSGQMQYLLESNTWVEAVPEEQKCAKTKKNRNACESFHAFASDFNDCRL
ncbi:unnamed protein product [Merluccius merluccius]